VGRIAGYNSREVTCTAHVCLCPFAFVLSVDTDKNESCLLVVLGMNTVCDVSYNDVPAGLP